MGPADDDTLEALLRAANRGDQRAYADFLRAITPVVRGIARARGAGLAPDVIEDIVQETLLAIHQKRHTWREDMAVRPWLYAIVRYKVVDAFRARGRRVQVPIEDFAEVLPAEAGPDPTERSDAERVIARLDPRAARIVRAIGLEGASIAETSAALHMTETAVRVALHRGAEAARAAAREDDRMRTEQLIQAMAADSERALRRSRALLPAAVLVTALAVAAVFLPLIGVRPDLGGAAHARCRVLVKQAFPLLLALAAGGAALRLACPGHAPSAAGRLALAAVPAVLLLAVAGELSILPAGGLDAGDDGPEQRPVRGVHQRDVAAAPRRRALGAPPRRQHPAGAERRARRPAQRRRGGDGLRGALHRGQPALLRALVRARHPRRDRARRAPRRRGCCAGRRLAAVLLANCDAIAA